jgi:hypothetical protein
VKPYTPQTWAAIDAADRAYTLRWGRAMAAFGRETGLRQAMDAYNEVMGPACQQWKADMAAAVALSEPSLLRATFAEDPF